jgi:hypothetical protein
MDFGVLAREWPLIRDAPLIAISGLGTAVAATAVITAGIVRWAYSRQISRLNERLAASKDDNERLLRAKDDQQVVSSQLEIFKHQLSEQQTQIFELIKLFASGRIRDEERTAEINLRTLVDSTKLVQRAVDKVSTANTSLGRTLTLSPDAGHMYLDPLEPGTRLIQR